jgi:hypothetical protein
MTTYQIATDDFTPDSSGVNLNNILRLRQKQLPTGSTVVFANACNTKSGTQVTSAKGNHGVLSTADDDYVHYVPPSSPRGADYSGFWFYESDSNGTVAPYVTIGAAGDSNINIEHTQSYTFRGAFRVNELPVSGQYGIFYTTVTHPTDYKGHEAFYGTDGKIRVRIIQTLNTDMIGLVSTETFALNTDYIVHVTYDGSRNASGVHVYLTNLNAGTCAELTMSNEDGVSTLNGAGTLLSSEQQFTLGNQQNFNRFGMIGYMWFAEFSKVVRTGITSVVSWATLPAKDASHLIYQDCTRGYGSGFADGGTAALTVSLAGGCAWLPDAPDQLGGNGGFFWTRDTTANLANIEVTNEASYRFTSGNFSIECFARYAHNPTSNTSPYAGTLLCNYGGAGGWALLFMPSSTATAIGQPTYANKLCVYDGTAFRSSGLTCTDNDWHHYAVTFDGTNYRFYVDGALGATVAGNQPSSDTGTLTIGTWKDGGVQGWRGNIANVILYNTALNLAAVQADAVRYETSAIYSLTSPIDTTEWSGATSLYLPLVLPTGTSAEYRVGHGASGAAATSNKEADSWTSAANGANTLTEGEGQYFDIDVKLYANSAKSATPLLTSVTGTEISLTYEAAAVTPVSAEQNTFRWYEDDGALGAGTPVEAADTAIAVSKEETLRLRFGILALEDGQGRYYLQHRINGADWETTTAGSTGVRITSSSNFTDGDSTTQVLTSPATYTGGEGVETARNTSNYFPLTNEAVEIEYNLYFADTLNLRDRVEFRLLTTTSSTHGTGGEPLTAYTVTPIARISARSITMRKITSSATQGAYIGLESTAGTPVAATKRLPSVSFLPQKVVNRKRVKPSHSRFGRGHTKGKGRTEGTYEAEGSFSEILYLLSSMWSKNPASVYLLTTTNDSDNYTLTFRGATTGNIAANASAATIATAIRALSTIADAEVQVTGSAGSYKVYLTGALTYAEDSLTGAGDGFTALANTNGFVPASLGVWTFTQDGNASHSYTASFGGVTSGSIAGNANTAAVQAAFEAMSTIDTNVLVELVSSNVYRVTLLGALAGDTRPLQMSGTGLSAGPTVAAISSLYKWLFVPRLKCDESPQTYTLEKGNCSRATQVPYVALSSMELRSNDNELTLNGNIFGRVMDETITLSEGVADVAPRLIDPAGVNIYIGTSLNNLTLLEEPLESSFSFGTSKKPRNTQNSAYTSFTGVTGTPYETTFTFVLPKSDEALTELDNLDDGTRVYIVWEVEGATLDTYYTERLRITMAADLTGGSHGDSDDAYAVTFTADVVEDSTLGGAMKIEVDTTLSTL